MPVADVTAEIVLRDHLAYVGQDLFGCGDRRPDPWLEAVGEGVQVAVGADAGIAVRTPGAAKALLAFQDDEALAREIPAELIGAADAGDTGADDQDIDMRDALRSRIVRRLGF